MITEIKISGLRGIENGCLREMGPLVVLVGPNGCGKSTVLDALLIGAGPRPGDAIGRSVRRRPYSRNGSRWMFSRLRGERFATIAVDGIKSGSVEKRSTALTWLEQPDRELVRLLAGTGPEPFSAITASITHSDGEGVARVGFAADNKYKTLFLGSFPRGWEMRLIDSPQGANENIEDVYSKAVEQGRKALADDSLREVLGGTVRGVTLLTDNGFPVIHVEYEDGSVPVSVSGEGVASLVRIALELAGRPGGTVLLEEPEAHQHPRIIWQTAAIIWATIQRGVQVILTTHSLDLIDALLSKAPPGQLNKLTIYRLNLDRGSLTTSRISGDDAATQRADFEDDLR